MNKLETLKNRARDNLVPIVRDGTAMRLQEECKKLQPKAILEIGTAVGYSAILMLSNCEGELCTLEKNEERMQEAKKNFEEFSLQERVETRLGDAKEELAKLIEEKRKFDFVFLDGPKGQYIYYYPLIKQLLNCGGVLFADNVNLLGLTQGLQKVTHKNRTMTRNMLNFIEEISKDKDFSSQMFDIDDGFLIAKKIN